MKLWQNGRLLLCVVVSVLDLSCKQKSLPPPIDLCQGDGLGGADCLLIPESPLISLCSKKEFGFNKQLFSMNQQFHWNSEPYFCPPSALKNSWITTQVSMAKYASWCSGVSAGSADEYLNKIQDAIQQRIESDARSGSEQESESASH